MNIRSRMVAMALMSAIGAIGGHEAIATPRAKGPKPREQRTEDDISARQAKRRAKLARRAAKAKRDAAAQKEGNGNG